MTSKLVVNTIEADTGISSVSFASSISMNSTAKFHFSAAGIDIGADTNINRPAAGVLGFNVNGTEKVRIDTNGHIHGVGVVTATHFFGDGSNLTGITQTTINNNANDRVITGSGTANTLEAEANLTFDGTTLTLTGNQTVSGTVQVAGNSNFGAAAASPSPSALTVKMATNKHIGFNPNQSEVGNVPALVAFQDNGSLNSIGFRGSDVRFATGSAERLRIDGDGRIGINANPSVNHEYLHIKPVGNNVLDLRYELNSDTDIRHKFYDNAGVWRGGFNYTTYANSSAYPNFHDSFYFLTDPGSNGTLSTALRITNTGQFIKPLTYQFFVETSGTSVSGGWNKLTGFSPDSTHCTGVSNGTYWSNSNSRFTAPVTGTYNFFIGGFSPTAEGGGTNHRYMYLFRINGGNYKYGCGGNYSDNNTPMAGGSLNYKLTVNDYVEVWYYSAISATWGNSSHRFFWGGILLG